MHVRKMLALLVEAEDGALLLRPPNLEDIGIFGGDGTSTLGLVPLSVNLVAAVSKTGKRLST
jgi:hypothetical protein